MQHHASNSCTAKSAPKLAAAAAALHSPITTGYGPSCDRVEHHLPPGLQTSKRDATYETYVTHEMYVRYQYFGKHAL